MHVPTVRPCSHRVHTDSQGPYSCSYAHSWPPPLCVCLQSALPLHRYLQLAPTAECVHTTHACHHACQPWLLATGPGDTVEDPNSPCIHCRTSAVLSKDRTVVNVIDQDLNLGQRDLYENA